MNKLLKRIKKWFVYNGRTLMMLLLMSVTIGLGVWYAIANNEEVVVEDFGDATLSVVAQEISDLSYEDALELLANGEEDKGLAVMHRLAPLSQAIAATTGNGDAHLWMALDQLHVEEFGFLNEFPINYVNGTALEAPVAFDESELTKRGEQHLEAAVKLSPELKRPPLMLAELLIAKGKRNNAIAVLTRAASSNEGEFLDMGVNVANATVYKGDDLALKEACWHQVAVLGKRVQNEARGDISARLEYLLNVMVLGEAELAAAGVQSFERDFDDRKNSVAMIAGLKATHQYFEALADLQASDSQAAAAHLVEAQKLQAGREVFVSALSALVKEFPELRNLLQAGVSTADAAAQVADKQAAAKLALLQAELFPEKAEAYVKESASLAPADPAVALAYISQQLAEGAPNLAELPAMAAEALQAPGLKSAERYQLLLLQGELLVTEERWREAVISLERAMVSKSHNTADPKIHKLLGLSYKKLGQDLIGDEHLALAE